ncbi:uncharacterized protein LOC125041850 isoform X2 [Penaeus chinensis]|uniref:uncharacterized protein LOC125041850 isoform X2 n=1 Tax=Penaeus chinensis TaxID=139456 RepID=UPI001FB58A80|nr:uncharacterized protein LOC125041850 isoform X2 [Penaeus chinensis]
MKGEDFLYLVLSSSSVKACLGESTGCWSSREECRPKKRPRPWRISVRMASAPRLALGFLLSLLGVCVEGNCPTFLSAKDQNFSCLPSCLQPSASGKDPVFGTEYYNASSEVCLSALHAGVVGLRGGDVQFRNVGESPIIGSMINRIVSRSGEPAVAYAFIKENLPLDFSEDDLTEKVLVHNSYFEDDLHLSCVAERQNVVLDEGSIARLEYEIYRGKANVFQARFTDKGQCAFPFAHNGITNWECIDGRRGDWCFTASDWGYCTKYEGPWRVHWNKAKSSNLHVFRCLGTQPAADILAAIQTSGQTYTAASATFRASRGDRLEIQLEKDPQAVDVVFFRRFPDDWTYTSNNVASTRLPLTVDPVSPADNGVYLLGNSGTGRWGKDTEKEIGSNGAYFHLAVRDCEAGRYGWNCESWCPDCENGGICHPRTGTCICPPGYMGPTCQIVCSQGRFGSICQLECTKASLGFDLPEEGSCHHLTICLPDPYGCSCAAGHTGPLCERRCKRGSYGAGCTLSCESFCENGNCNSTTGKCSNGCKSHIPCTVDGSVLNLPRLSRPPGITGVTSTSALVVFSPWHRDMDYGSTNFSITGYRVRYRIDQDADWQETDSSDSHSGDRSVQLENLWPGYKYRVRVLVVTEHGFLDGSTNQRVQTADFITNCSDPSITEVEKMEVTNSSISLSWSLDIQVHPRCEVTYVLEFGKKSGGSKIQRTTNSTSFTFADLDPDTEYELVIGLYSGIARQPKFIEKLWPFRTLISPPLAPILSLEITAIREIKVKWELPRQSSHVDIYDVSHQLLKYEACKSHIPHPATKAPHTATEIYLRDLESYATYEVCVVARNVDGSGPAACSSETTLPTAPEIQLRYPCRYQDTGYLSCQLVGTCEQYNGPNARAELIIETFLECANKSLKEEYSKKLASHYITFSLNKIELLKGATYSATVAFKNDAGTGLESTTSFQTYPAKAPRVKDLVGAAVSPREVRLMWNDPCPPKGKITSFVYKLHSIWKYRNAEPCTSLPKFDRCIEIENLMVNTNYTFEVAAVNSVGIGYPVKVSVSTIEAKPGPPSGMSTLPGDSSIEVFLQFPVAPGGVLQNFTTRLADGQHSCWGNITRESRGPAVCKLQGLERGKTYSASGSFCNSAGCGPSLAQDVATLPIPPIFKGALGVLAKTDTNITLSLPSIQTEGDGESSLIVLVQHIPKEEISNYRKKSFMELYAKLMERHRARAVSEAQGPETRRDRDGRGAEAEPQGSPRQKRLVGDGCKNRDGEYIAGIFDNEQQKEFVIGDEDSGYDNCPLTPDDFYMIGAVARVDLLDQQSYAETSLDAPVKAAFDVTNPLAIALPLLLVLALLLLGLSFVYLKKFRKPKDPSEFQDSNTRILDDGMNHSEGNSNLIHVQQQNVALMPMPVRQQYQPTAGPTTRLKAVPGIPAFRFQKCSMYYFLKILMISTCYVPI